MQFSKFCKSYIFCLIISLLLISCGSSDSSDEPDNADTFSIQVSPVEFEVEIGQQFTLSYLVTNNGSQTVTPRISQPPSNGEVSINETEQRVLFTSGQQAGTGQFVIEFVGPNQTETVTIDFSIINNSSGGGNSDDGSGGNSSGGDGAESVNEKSYRVVWPSDYITIFENEEVTIDIKRNYPNDGNVLENFYLNSANLVGKLSDDESQYIIKAIDAEEDTFGELMAVSELNGEIIESKMQVIFYNKNRDLLTSEPPVIALIEPEMSLNLYETTTLLFDIYDPDSDRLSYRVLSAPYSVTTHVNKAEFGYELSVTLHDDLNEDDTVITLQVSDAHLTDEVEINLVQAPESNTGNNSGNTTNNKAPSLTIEENVTLSLIKRLFGNENEEIANFAYVLEDEKPEFVNITVTSTDETLTFKDSYPYLNVFSDDVSELEYEQVTLRASENGYETKLTFHLYNKSNFLTFLGGHPNLAPLIEIPVIPPILESKSYNFDMVVEDFESHPYEIVVSTDESLLSNLVDGDNITLTASLLPQPDNQVVDVDFVVTDVFGSERIVSAPVTIYKNTAPDITTAIEAVDIVETASLEFELNINDVDEGFIEPQLIYDVSKLDASFENGVVTVNAYDIEEDFTDSLLVRVEDEFGEVTELALPLIIRIDNNPPQIELSEASIELAPGQSKTVWLTYFDPDGTKLTTSRFTNNSLLTEEYDQNTGQLTLTLDPSAEYQQTMSFITTASDGFDTVSATLTVIVPLAPAPPELDISVFNPEVDEEEILIVNYSVSDENGDDVVVTVADGGTANFDELNIEIFEDYLQISVPENVLIDTRYLLEITATEDTEGALSTSETIEFNVLPVNDAPVLVTESNQFILINDYTSIMSITISDEDNQAADLDIELLSDNGNALPNNIEVVGIDVNSVRLKATSKGVSISSQAIVLRVFDGESYTEKTLYVSAQLENKVPVFGTDNNPAIDSIQVLESFSDNFDIQISDPDFNKDGDIATIKSIQIGNVSGANQTNTETVDGVTVRTQVGVGVTVSQVEQFTANNRIHIATAANSGDSTVNLVIIATDGYQDTTHTVQIKIVSP